MRPVDDSERLISVERDSIFMDIHEERERQDAKWGDAIDRDLALTTWLTVLVEEVGEAAEAILKGPRRSQGRGQLRAELIQVAAVAVAMIEANEYLPPWGLSEEAAG